MDVLKNPFLFFIGLTLIVSCNNKISPSDAVGNYRGTIVNKKTNYIQQIDVSAEVTRISHQELQLVSTPIDPLEKKMTLLLTFDGRNSAKLGSNDLDIKNITLNSLKNNCLASELNNSLESATLCFNGTDLTLAISWKKTGEYFNFSVSKTTTRTYPELEKPQTYTLEQVVQKSLAQNFNTPIEFERVVQAKLKARTAYLNLIPHLSINSVLNIASLNILHYLKAAGDVVPFLFPTRWMQAKEAKFASEAEFDAMILSKADSAHITEELAYGVLRDSTVIAAIEANQKYISEVLAQVRQREMSGIMQAGASDDIASILNTISQGSSEMSNNLKVEKMALAESAGFYNFEAISEIQTSKELPIEQMQPYDSQAINRIAQTSLDRSYECRQLDSLIQEARIKKKERYFQWLDPSGDRDGGLGVSLGSYVKIGTSQIQELIYKKQQLEASIIDQVAAAALRSNDALEAYALAREAHDIQTRRVDRHLGNMKSGINFSMSDLTNALQEKMKSDIQLIYSQFNYYIARSSLNRLLLSGFYSLLPSDQGEPTWTIPK